MGFFVVKKTMFGTNLAIDESVRQKKRKNMNRPKSKIIFEESLRLDLPVNNYHILERCSQETTSSLFR